MIWRDFCAKIQSSDFLISDEQCIHRLAGLRYESETMSEPEVSFICSRSEMALAKHLAFKSGKKIYHDSNSKFSARLFNKYYCGEHLREFEDLADAAELYAKFYSQNHN